MRPLRLFFILILPVFSWSQENYLPENFDLGSTEDTTYKNVYFDMEVSFHANWVVQNQESINYLVEQGTEIIVNDDEQLKSIVKASKVNSAYLFTVFKYELGSAVDYNPSFLTVAENTINFPGIKSGKDYLFHARKLLERSQVGYSFADEIKEIQLGKANFHIMKTELAYMNLNIIQEYVSTVVRGFSLSFILSYTNEKQRSELYEILESVILK